MENKVTKIMAVLMVMGLMAGPVAYAESQQETPAGDPGMQQPGPWGEGPEGKTGFHHRGSMAFFKDLNLSPEQKAKLDAQREAKKEANKALRDQLKTKMQALHEEISKPGTTRASVEGLVSEVNTLKGQMFAQKIDGVFAMKEVLTPEQFAKMQAKHKGFWEKVRGGWGGHPKGPWKDQPEVGKN